MNQHLSELFGALASYKFDLASPPPDEKCFVCLREFGETDGPLSEPPCHAVKITPSCKHIIGSECVKEYMKNQNICGLCRTAIKPVPDGISPWLKRICTTACFVNEDRAIWKFATECIFPKQHVDYLYDRLFARDMGMTDVYHLWLCHAAASLYGQVENSKTPLNLLTVVWILIWPWRPHYPELSIFAKSVDAQSQLWCIALLACAWIALHFVAKMHMAYQEDRQPVLLTRYRNVASVLFIHSMVVLFGFTGLFAYKTASILAFCMVDALLMAHCVNFPHLKTMPSRTKDTVYVQLSRGKHYVDTTLHDF